MSTSTLVYKGGMRLEATHQQSGTTLITDAPTDNHGKGEAFSPTDLMATSLPACMLTTVEILLKDRGINISGTTCTVNKVMAANPRRIAEIQVTFKFPLKDTYSRLQKELIEKTAMSCPVAQSLHPDVKKVIDFGW